MAAFLSACPAIFAETISAQQAKAYAEKFFGISASTKSSSSLSLVWEGSQPSTKATIYSEPALYVFNKSNGGFVAISAETEYHPLLAYSEVENFDPEGIPDGLRWLMGTLEAEIRDVRSNGTKAGAVVKKEWENIASLRTAGTKAGTSKKLETAQWGQGAPYNNECPQIEGEQGRSITGCVATASAILMHYQANHRENVPDSPEQTTLPDYSYSSDNGTVNITGHSLVGHSYNFTEMPYSNSDVQKASANVKADIAELMHDLGVAYRMAYGYDGSGTQGELCMYAMGTFFKYCKNNRSEYRDSYSESEWFAKIKNSIDNNNPVFYCGQGSDGGHCFLIVGYETNNNLVNINWGWNGGSNSGYYRLGERANFPDKQMAVFNLIPNTTGQEDEFPASELSLISSNGSIGLQADGTIQPNQYFEISVFWLYNRGPLDANPYLRFVLVSNGERNSLVQFPNKMGPISPGSGIGFYGSMRLSADQLSLGNVIELEYSEDCPDNVSKVKTWIPVETNNDGSVVYALPVVPMFVLDLPSECKKGQAYELKLINGDIPWSEYTEWSWESSTSGASASINTGKLSDNHNYITFNKAGTYTVTGKVRYDDRKERIRAVINVK